MYSDSSKVVEESNEILKKVRRLYVTCVFIILKKIKESSPRTSKTSVNNVSRHFMLLLLRLSLVTTYKPF